MSNRRVKSLAYDDEYDEYEEENGDDDSGLSAEDREQLRLGTIKVRELLGPEFTCSDEEIQEALWHYYYDVTKSVTYLKNKRTPPPPSTKKKANTQGKHRYAEYMWVARQFASNTPDRVLTNMDVSDCPEPFSTKAFFQDCPWFNIPAHRKANILIEPLYPRIGLLGGSSTNPKMSKLAALAAKRRQKENLKPVSPTINENKPEPDYASHLSNLRISAQESPNQSLPKTTFPLIPKRNGLFGTAGESGEAVTDGAKQANPSVELPRRNPEPILVAEEIQASPSLFARTMIGSGMTNPVHSNVFATANTSLDTKSFAFVEPSPDDVVMKAQSAKAPSMAKTKQKETARTKTNLNQSINNLSIQEPIKISNKNLDVISEYKKFKRKNTANFVVIGHVDAGKSTLMGRLLFELKAVDQRTMDKYKKEAERIGKGSFAFAWVLDQGTEERARGVTIDIATNNFETEKTSFTILDAPGHRDFVPNMIAGASQADFAVLVIDASTGNFESGLKGQTKEHALLVRSIGVQRLIVAVNKMDTAEWSQDRFQEIKQQMSGFLTTAGFQPKNVSFVPCSGLEGGNILVKTPNPNASWYTGDTLVEELDKSEPIAYAIEKPLRMTIGDVFRGGVQNPLSVSGRIEVGNIQIGEQIIVMPSGEKAFVKSLEVDDEPQDWAVAGQNVVLNLTDIDAIHLKTGDVLCSSTSPIQNINTFTAKILAFDHLTPMNVDIHRGRLHVPGRISQLIATLDKASGKVLKKKPKIVQPGSLLRVVVELEQAVPLEAPARVVFRANGETVGAGLIE